MGLTLFYDSASILAALALVALRAPAEQPAGPLTPQQAVATFHFADEELMIELVAAEPEVVSPVAMAWDADGRLFVAEMLDYPNSTNGGRIKLLEDRDGDGRYERASVFAERLSFPNGVLPWNGGVLVTAAPDILFLKDIDGDGRADERRVVLTGFGQGNQQLRVNGLFWGLDNWIYGANGRSDGEIRRPNAPAATGVSLRGHDFRFRPDTGEFEVIAGRSQFGTTRDDWGNRFLSWNTIPIRHEILPERYLTRNASLASTESVFDILSPGDDNRVFPLTPPPLVFNTESASHFNALAGLTIYRGDALGEKYRGNAFAGESLRNLVQRRVLVPDGVTFIARRGEEGKEFLASSDPWFHPVNFATGPDGALYIADFYRRFVEHPGFVPENLREQIAWRTGAEHGRIWRVHSRNLLAPARPKPELSRATSAALVEELANQNAWRRDTAQRLLVERRDPQAIPLLKGLFRTKQRVDPIARLGALWTLDGLGALDNATIKAALREHEPAVRKHAVQLAERRLSAAPDLSRKVGELKNDPDPRVRFQLALSLGEWRNDARLEPLAQLAQRDFRDRWISSALLSSVGSSPGLFLEKLVRQDSRWMTAPALEQSQIIERLGRLAGQQNDDVELARCLAVMVNDATGKSGSLALLAGLADGLSRTSRHLVQLLNNPPATNATSARSLARSVEQAASIAGSPNEAVPRRLQAIRILAHLQPEAGGSVLLGLLQGSQTAEIQSAAMEALAGFGDHGLAGRLFDGWKQYPSATRRHLAALAPRSTATTTALVEALEAGTIAPDEIDPTVREALRTVRNPDLARRLKKFVGPASSASREEIVKSFQPSLKMAGDRRRGAATFARLCLQCHAISNKGNRVGPDLSGIATRPREAVLVDILDPSRQVTPDFVSYTVTTVQGETLTGLLAAESGSSITLRRAGQADETILRTQITALRAEGKSLMPDGLEQGLTQQDLADLLEFLQQLDSKLLPQTN